MFTKYTFRMKPHHWVCKPANSVPVPRQDEVGGLWQEGHPAGEDEGGGSLISPDGVAPSRMVGVSASVIFPCITKSTRFSGTVSLMWSRKQGRKTVVCGCIH